MYSRYVVNFLLVVDDATCYQRAQRLVNETSDAIWTAVLRFSMYSYLGPPGVITHDASTNFSSRELASNTYFLHIRFDPVPKEAHQSITTVDRHHATLPNAFLEISKASPPTATERTDASLFHSRFYDLLQMA